MRWHIPLSVRFVGWFLLNLVMLAVVFGVVIRSELRPDALLGLLAGDRVQKVADVLAGELASRPAAEWGTTLERVSGTYGVRFALVDERGQTVAGPTLEFPESLRERLRGFRGGGRRGMPPAPPGLVEGGPPRRLVPGLGREFLRTENPTRYWVVLPAVIGRPDPGPVRPYRLVIESRTLGGGGLFLDFRPWWLAGGAILVLSVLWWLPFVGSITRSLGQMTTATEAIAEGRFNVALNDRRGDELGRLGGAINAMSGRLEGFVTGHKRFLGDIAHELCSPLARMEMALGVLDHQATGTARDYVGDLREDVRLMSGLVNELLSFSKAGLQSPDRALARVVLDGLIVRVVAREAPNDGRVSVRVPPGVAVEGDEELLARAVGNLLRNAVRYSGDRVPITIEAEEDGEFVALAVRDEGPGVPPASLGRLGEPFYRPDPSRARESGGAGLGLAIVRTCVEACRGRVSYRNREPSGFEAVLRLRRAA
ncbi:MAG: HAMP domain-containing histidine kinase [Verrucomicrobiae bacterium]|nr:HAMP domain-containing histidine kinase [Verrucomicrobiae bacterium]